MFTVDIKSDVGQVGVETTHNRANKIISISQSADPVLRQQAEAFKSQIQQIVLYYMKQSAKSERTTIYNLLLNAGEASLAEHIRRL